jgi:hypothetical protein
MKKLCNPDNPSECDNSMLGIRDAKGLEFPHVVLVNFFCQFKSKQSRYEKEKENKEAEKKDKKVEKELKEKLKREKAEREQREKLRQDALKWIFGTGSKPDQLPKEVEVDMKVLPVPRLHCLCFACTACASLALPVLRLHCLCFACTACINSCR